MKISELLTEAKRVATDKGYYTPGYDSESKHIIGTVEDWLARLEATPEDVAAAVAEAKKLPSYEKLVSVCKDTTNAGEKKNGTFSFKRLSTDKFYRDEDGKWHVYANGQIRSSSLNSINGDRRPTRIAAPKPRVVAGSAIKSLVKIYDGAFAELLNKAEKKLGAEAKKDKVTEAVGELAAIKKLLTTPAHSKIREVQDEDDSVYITVEYDMPEHAIATKEIRAIMKPEFTRVMMDRDGDTGTGVTYTLVRKS